MAFVAAAEPREASGVPDGNIDQEVAMQVGDIRATADVHLDARRRHRSGFFTDGRRLIWEYPREAPDGDQMDFVESMGIENGLIRRHCVCWGWFGVRGLDGDRCHR
jgi:hypothetical protein